MIKICVGSKNELKGRVVLEGYLELFSSNRRKTLIVGCEAKSGVASQPMNDEEAFLGAKNRAAHAMQLVPDCNFYVGVEGGLEEKHGVMQEFTWVYIISENLVESISRSASFTIPPEVASLVRAGVELGQATDEVFGVRNSNHSYGLLGIVSNNIITRSSYIKPAVMCAFLPYRSPHYKV